VTTKPKSPFTGRWRIVSMNASDHEFIDDEVDGYSEFDTAKRNLL
jgi:hypothetical protein